MNCLDVERILPEVLDTSLDTSFDTPAETAAGSSVGSSVNDIELQAHLKSCPACAALIADLRLIVNEAATLAESEEPPERVWVGIANQLRAEGLIHDPEALDHKAHPAGPVLVPTSVPRRKTLWWMAPVAAAVLAAGSYQLIHHSGSNNTQVAQLQTPPASVAQSAPTQPTSPSSEQASQSADGAAPGTNQAVETAQQSALSRPAPANSQLAQNQNGQRVISPSNSEDRRTDDQRFLSEVSSRAPSMRSTYESQLRAVNSEILETQAYIQQHPNDVDARQHLLDVFQQKSLLYQMALDRIQ